MGNKRKFSFSEFKNQTKYIASGDETNVGDSSALLSARFQSKSSLWWAIWFLLLIPALLLKCPPSSFLWCVLVRLLNRHIYWICKGLGNRGDNKNFFHEHLSAQLVHRCIGGIWMFQPVLTRGAKVLYGPEDGLTLPQGACDGFLEKSRLRFILKKKVWDSSW